IVATTESCCARSAPTPALAKLTARRATPGGKRQVSRNRIPVRQPGTNRGKLIAATPAVVPPPSHSTADRVAATGSPPSCADSRAKTRYAAMTTTEERIGEIG